ncbi:hypothetical protein R1sor_021095 [Riccia sorocarpa]|uniref:Uncharacterized protein n=1 Tax=Riccia sorocarpa TaxID=122646 RepID=A0ABD3GLS4_9MARC
MGSLVHGANGKPILLWRSLTGRLQAAVSNVENGTELHESHSLSSGGRRSLANEKRGEIMESVDWEVVGCRTQAHYIASCADRGSECSNAREGRWRCVGDENVNARAYREALSSGVHVCGDGGPRLQSMSGTDVYALD